MAHGNHHEKRTIMVNLLVIPMVIGVLIVLTIFDKPVARVVNLPYKMVAGTHDAQFEEISKETFTKELASDTKEQLDSVKENVLDTTIRDLVSFLGKSSRIKEDVNNLGEEAIKMLDNLDIDPAKQLRK